MDGIDVSHHQGNIDWKKVKNSGIGFAMLKASQGSKLSDCASEPFEDEKFGEYVKGASENGILCGAYHFLTGTTSEAVGKETNFFIKTIKKHAGAIKYPCACDLEDPRYKKLKKNENSALVRIFAEKVKKAGFIPMLYTNLDFLKNHFDVSMLGGIDIWFARYYASRSPLPKPDISGLTMFQWTDSGIVDGVSGKVDLDVCYFEYSGKNCKGLSVGDKVVFKSEAKTYWPSGPSIPAYAKINQYSIIQTASHGKAVVKGGAKCVLLDGINTWAAEEALMRV